MAVSSTSSGSLKTGVCLSTDRPDNPYNGQVIYETDTNRTLIYDNSAWVVISDPSLLSYSGTGATVTADAMTVAGENVTPYTGRKNYVINGDMRISQRGTTFNSVADGSYTLDRWVIDHAGGTTINITQESFPLGQTDVVGAKNYLRMNVVTSGDFAHLDHRIEDVTLFDNRTVTLSFWAKASSSMNLAFEWLQYFGAGGSAEVRGTNLGFSLTTSWQKFTYTINLPSLSGKTVGSGSSLRLRFVPSSTDATFASRWGANGNFTGTVDLALVQLEVGDKATPFEHRSFGEELALCQRYFEKSSNYEDAVGNSMGTSVLTVGSVYVDGWQGTTNIPFKVNKRSAPSVAMYGPSGANTGWLVYNHAGTAYNAVGTYALNINQHNFRIMVTTWNGSSGTLNYTNGLSYAAAGAWTASAEL
jgi:hypothetical protein